LNSYPKPTLGGEKSVRLPVDDPTPTLSVDRGRFVAPRTDRIGVRVREPDGTEHTFGIDPL